jgi:hypothetical protein
MSYRCLVCGYDGLHEPPRSHGVAAPDGKILVDPSGIGSDVICPCCGTQFGYDDEAGGDLQKRLERYRQLRHRWVRAGMRWWSTGQSPPLGWDPAEQLRQAGLG